MKKFGMIVVISMIISGLVFTNVAFAGKVGKRQVHQQKRICQGVKSGELTGRETHSLEREHTFSTIDASSHVTFLVEKARDGSRTAFNELVDLFQKDIFRMVFYRTRSRMDAEDLTQDIFIQAFKNLSRLKTPDRLIMDIGMLVENALPPVFLDITGEQDSEFDKEFMQFVVPPIESSSPFYESGMKGVTLC